jgi:DNA-directed RNA polymerase subunit M/transcription elongation factor TFIIS
MPVGDKNFNDLVDHVREVIQALNVGYPRVSWSGIADRLNKLFTIMCKRYKTDVGWRHECSPSCPFKIELDLVHPCCITQTWYRNRAHQKLYSICDGTRSLNPTYSDLRQCGEIVDDYRIFLNELLAGYWEKERVAKPPGTSVGKPTYVVANEVTMVSGSPNANTCVTPTAVAVSGGYSTTTILGPAGNTSTTTHTGDHGGEEEGEDEDDEPETHECEYCGNQFESEDGLEAHMNNNHPYCDLCERRFSDDDAYGEHYDREHADEDNTYGCPDCGDEFDTNRELVEHVRTTHPVEEAQRQQAAAEATREALEAIARGNRGITEVVTAMPLVPQATRARAVPMIYGCNVCGDRFANARSLRGHRLLDHPRHTHICVNCNAAFESPGSLGAHMAEHHR